jgi:hypothetical protein
VGDLNDFARERGADGNDVLHSTVFGEVFRSATPANDPAAEVYDQR